MNPGPETRLHPETIGALPDLLVPPSWLKPRLGSRDLRIIDMREAETYAEDHIPGATNLLLTDLGKNVAGLDNVLLPPGEFSALMARHGISNGDAVVAYDDQWGLAAARLIWALHYYGHENVAVLDGGWDGWLDEGGAASASLEQVEAGSFEAASQPDGRAAPYADRDAVLELIRSGEVILLDTRTPAEFAQGHLPGALCWDWFNAVPDGSWGVSRDPDELRTEWAAMGFVTSDEVVVYCRSGMRAAHTYLVLRAAGFAKVRLYDGSWQEWSMNEREEAGD